MDPGYLDKIEEGGAHLYYADWERTDVRVENVTFYKCRFEHVGLRGSTFKHVTFFACRFVDLYLPYGKFENVNLTAARFTDCNLRHTKFNKCILWYTEFHQCELDYKSLLADLPEERNLRMRLLRNLRLNAESTGDGRMADKLYILEMDAFREDQWNAWSQSEEHYQKEYVGAHAQFGALAKYIGLTIDSVVWGYGIRIRNLFLTALSVILLSGLLVWIGGLRLVHPVLDSETTKTVIGPVGFWESMYVSVVSFTTLGYGDYAPWSFAARTLLTIDAASGAIFLGLLAAAAYRRISR